MCLQLNHVRFLKVVRVLGCYSCVRFYFFIAISLCCLFVAIADKRFVDTRGAHPDGYADQLEYVKDVIAEGQLLEQPLLVWVHVARTVPASFFSFLYELGGAALVSIGMAAFFFPLLKLFEGSRYPIFAALLPFIMIVFSYRAALVALSIGYLMLFFLVRPKRWYLLVLFIFSNLSSGSVLTCIFMAFFMWRRTRVRSYSLGLCLAFLSISLCISLQHKIGGFIAGDAGYETMISGVDGFWALFTRGTIVVSFLDGDYARVLGYSTFLMSVLLVLIYAFIKRGLRPYVFIIAIALPSFLLEGLGVVTLLVPVLILLSQRELPAHCLPVSVAALRDR